MKHLAIFAVLALLVGCRSVKTSNAVTNNFTAGKNIVLTESGTDSVLEGTQAADKEVGDISPSTSATVTPK